MAPSLNDLFTSSEFDFASLADRIRAGSPYLTTLLERHAAFVQRALQVAPELTMAEVLDRTQNAWRNSDVDTAAQTLRTLKAQAALFLAVVDLGGVWSLEQVTTSLTDFADAAVQCAVNALLQEASRTGKFNAVDLDDPSRECGYVLLAMGKHGAHELNYSSDIDLIALFDADAQTTSDPAGFFVKLTKRLVAVLQDLTPDGYVFRTDLRLRPDPRATQVAISLESAAIYYENMGQNWERAAYIKARAIAGDVALGQAFLARLTPYIWRKYLDFAAIADVQSLIKQIHAVKGHGEIAVEGHNLKLGRGGIREIEFFVQTQQLIAGGRNPKLRGRGTLAMLAALAEAQWIAPDVSADLQRCYSDLRTWEHRAQMVDDQQTHHVPEGPAFESYAKFCGFESAEEMRCAIRTTLETVQKHSSRLFADGQALASSSGSLVFTGGEDDPETLTTLRQMGFKEASEISATIRGWHFGRYPATRSRQSREILTELMPRLLEKLSQSGEADGSFMAFDSFLRGLPSGVQLFSMIKANPNLLDLITRILGTAPRMADGLSKRPRILEAVLEPGFFDHLPSKAELEAQVQILLPQTLSLEEAMDRARVFGREQQFRVGVRLLSESLSSQETGAAFSNIADVLLQGLLEAVHREMQDKHGNIEGAQLAIIAMGKLGGREMTASSDLDLILVYDHAAHAQLSDGARPLGPQQYFTRVTQRLIAALTAPTAEGQLYEVDLRLRPSGSSGPVAVSLESFKTYHSESAWTWEKLALTRARVIAGTPQLMEKLTQAIQHSLCQKRDRDQIRADVLDMRALMLRELKPQGVWDLKKMHGGTVDVEFIAQFLQLVTAAEHPEILSPTTSQALENLKRAGALTTQDADALLAAQRTYTGINHILRLCLDGPLDPKTASAQVLKLVAKAAEQPDFDRAEALILDHQERVRDVFGRILGSPN